MTPPIWANPEIFPRAKISGVERRHARVDEVRHLTPFGRPRSASVFSAGFAGVADIRADRYRSRLIDEGVQKTFE